MATSYEYQPEQIIRIHPGTQFIDNPMNHGEKRERDRQASAERQRTAILTYNANKKRFYRGRIFAHEKFYNMKQEVQKIKDLEQDSKSKVIEEKQPKGYWLEMMEKEDQFNVPVGTDFDYIIKERANQIDSQKKINSQKMDELVAQLGYMDYRDALACNKYIIEAKRSGDYN